MTSITENGINQLGTYLNYKIKGRYFDSDDYYDQGIDPNTLKQDKFISNAVELNALVTNTSTPLDIINIKKANGSQYDHSIFGNIIGKNQVNLFYFKNHKQPNIIV